MKIAKFVFNPFGENTYVVYDESTRHAAIIDPGMIDEHEERAIAGFIERNHLIVTDMILTHVHIDHSFGVDFVKKNYNVGVSANPADAFLGLTRTEQARMFHLKYDLPDVTIDRQLHEGDVITLGPDSTLKVLEVPGHSPGSIALYDEHDGVVFTGDALLPCSVGRTDVPGGNHDTLIRSIRQKLLTLPDSTIVLAGHTDGTTIGRERDTNRYLQ